MKKLRDGNIYITMKISCRGRDRGYNLTNRMMGEVARVVGFGHDNPEYKDDESEMTEVGPIDEEADVNKDVRMVQQWPDSFHNRH